MTRHLVDATGTRRRLRALAVAGWPAVVIAGSLGRPPRSARALVSAWRDPDRRRIHADTADAVAELYSLLSYFPGPSRAARWHALRAGWDGPKAWVGVDIDDPEARPRTGRDENGNEAA